MEDEFKKIDFDELEDDLKVETQEIFFRDPVVRKVVNQFVDRSDIGYDKYGQTLDSERREGIKDLSDYLKDVQEELMDAVLYIQAARDELKDKPTCKCQVKDVEPRGKTTLGDPQSIWDLKAKMNARKQVAYDRDNYGYVSDHT